MTNSRLFENMISYLQEHSIEVVSASYAGVVVVGVYAREGVPEYQEETLTTWAQMREWLGY